MNRVLFSKATQARLRSSLGEAKGTNFHWRHHKLVVGYERSISQMAIYLLPFMSIFLFSINSIWLLCFLFASIWGWIKFVDLLSFLVVYVCFSSSFCILLSVYLVLSIPDCPVGFSNVYFIEEFTMYGILLIIEYVLFD